MSLNSELDFLIEQLRRRYPHIDSDIELLELHKEQPTRKEKTYEEGYDDGWEASREDFLEGISRS